MKYVLVSAIILVAILAAKRTMPQAKPNESAIRTIVQEEVAAWNAGDAVAYSRHFAPDEIFVNIRGEYRTGVQAFTKQHEFLFNGPFHGSTLHQDIVSVQFVRPDVAVVEVLTAVTGIQKLSPGTNTDEKGRLRTRLLQVIVNPSSRCRRPECGHRSLTRSSARKTRSFGAMMAAAVSWYFSSPTPSGACAVNTSPHSLDPLAFEPPLTKRGIDRELKSLRDAVAAHPALQFVPEESQTIGGFGRNDRFSYHQLHGGPGEVPNRVLLEAGAASGREPTASGVRVGS